MSSWYRMICFGLIGLLHLSQVARASDTTRPKNVVLLFSFQTGLPVYDVLYEEIRGTIQSDVPGPVNVYAEYLDLVRFPNESYQQRLFDLYREKCAAKKIDLFIHIGQGAEKLIATYHTGFCRFRSPDGSTSRQNGPDGIGACFEANYVTGPVHAKRTVPYS
jgi:hypothetical protein